MRRVGVFNRFGSAAGAMGRELKFEDKNFDTIALTATGTPILQAGNDTLLEIAQNTGPSERIGRKITLKFIGLKLDLDMLATTSAVDTRDMVRFVLVLSYIFCLAWKASWFH